MHTVIETSVYLRKAERLGLTEKERAHIVAQLSENPDSGVVISGAGGARKLRVAGMGKGKSGGYRLITFFTGFDIPVFILTIYGKNEKANLSNAERNELGKKLQIVAAQYRGSKNEH